MHTTMQTDQFMHLTISHFRQSMQQTISIHHQMLFFIGNYPDTMLCRPSYYGHMTKYCITIALQNISYNLKQLFDPNALKPFLSAYFFFRSFLFARGTSSKSESDCSENSITLQNQSLIIYMFTFPSNRYFLISIPKH